MHAAGMACKRCPQGCLTCILRRTSAMKTDHSMETWTISKPLRATGTFSKLAMSRPHASAPIWLATCCGRELWSPRKLQQQTGSAHRAIQNRMPS